MIYADNTQVYIVLDEESDHTYSENWKVYRWYQALVHC